MSGGIRVINSPPLRSANIIPPVQVVSSTDNVTLMKSNPNRLSAMIFNDSTAILYVKFGKVAAATDFTVKIAAGGYFEIPYPLYTGNIDGIWVAANGNAYVTELNDATI